MKFKDLVKFKTAQVMFIARNNFLLGYIPKMFKDREGRHVFKRSNSFLTALCLHHFTKHLHFSLWCDLMEWTRQ